MRATVQWNGIFSVLKGNNCLEILYPEKTSLKSECETQMSSDKSKLKSRSLVDFNYNNNNCKGCVSSSWKVMILHE